MSRTPVLLCAALALVAAAAWPGSAAAQRRRSVPARKAPARAPVPAPAPAPAPPPATPTPSPSGAPGSSTSSSGAPPATQPAAPPTALAESTVDVDALRQEYLALRDQLFRSRARAAAVASSLYSTKLRILLDYGSSRFYTVTRATIRLDGASIYDDAQGAIANDRAPRWDGFVAPGRHLVTIRIEAAGKDDQRFTTALESSFAVQAPAGKDLVVKCAAKDEGDIAYQWQRNEHGSYRLRLDVSIESASRPGGQGGGRRAKR